MSNNLRQTGRMKIKAACGFEEPVKTQMIAVFGSARLLQNQDGRYELVGGTAHDHAEAREWCALFAPEVVFAPTFRRTPTLAFAA